MKLHELYEAKEAKQESKPIDKRLSSFLNKITQLLFKTGADWVKDKKRSKEAIFLGVVHTDSVIKDSKGKALKLTFDNSTDSGEFELNSLSPLMIEKGSDLDNAINELFSKHRIKSSKKTNYISRDGKMVMREIHVGVDLGLDTVKFIKDVIDLIASNTSRISE